MLAECERNKEHDGIIVILKTPNDGCIQLSAPVSWPKSHGEGIRLLKQICLKTETKKKGCLFSKKIPIREYKRIKDIIEYQLVIGGSVSWEEKFIFKNTDVFVKCRSKEQQDGKTLCYVGGVNQALDVTITRFLCIIGS